MSDAKGTSSYLILNPAAGSTAILLARLTRAARDTLNHFARDLGLDLIRPLRALEVFASGQHERCVDGWHAARALSRWLRPGS